MATVLLCCVFQPTHRCNSLEELSAQPTHAQSRPSIDSCMPTHFITSLVSMVTSNITDHYPCVGVDYSVGASRGWLSNSEADNSHSSAPAWDCALSSGI